MTCLIGILEQHTIRPWLNTNYRCGIIPVQEDEELYSIQDQVSYPPVSNYIPVKCNNNSVQSVDNSDRYCVP